MHQGCWGHGRAPTSPPRHWDGVRGAGTGARGHPGTATTAGRILLPSCLLRTLLARRTPGTESEAGEVPCSGCRRPAGVAAAPMGAQGQTGTSTGCWPHGGAGVGLQPPGMSPRCHRAPVHRGDCAQPTPRCTGSWPLRFIKTHKSPSKFGETKIFPQPLGLRQPLCTRMGKGQVGAARSWEGTKKGQNQGKNKSQVLPSTLLRSLKTLCRGCSRNWLKVSFAPQKGAGAAVAIAWPPPQQKQALPSKAVSQTPTPPALAGALQRQAD